MNRKKLLISAIFYFLLSLVLLFLIDRRLSYIEKLRCETWHWEVCDEVLKK